MHDLDLIPIQRLTKDLKLASKKLGLKEVRYLVDLYYMHQKNRKSAGNQIRSMEENEPHLIMDWVFEQNQIIENEIRKALDKFSSKHPVGEWMKGIKGIGPVISAGMLAHIDIYEAPTAGHIWSFAGIDVGTLDKVWAKGEKRPWCEEFRTLCWKAGDCFVKVSGGDEPAYYGLIYKQRKELEVERNESGYFKEQAKRYLERAIKQKWKKTSVAYKAYEAGKLPPAQLDARAKRYAVKIFLSHLHHKLYVHEFRKLPPKPFMMEIRGHVHYVEPPEAG